MKLIPSLLIGLLMITLMGAGQETKRVGDPYPLTICPVSQRPLGDKPFVLILEDMDDASMNGRELKFCCGGCRTRFMADAKTNLDKLDDAIIKDQLRVYPKANCIVMPDDEMTDPRGPEAMEDQNVVINNRLYRFCCKGCIRRFKKDPSRYDKALNELVKAQQAGNYPIDVCVISGRPLGENPTELVVANRLVRTCCGGCSKKVMADPTAVIARLDKARSGG